MCTLLVGWVTNRSKQYCIHNCRFQNADKLFRVAIEQLNHRMGGGWDCLWGPFLEAQCVGRPISLSLSISLHLSVSLSLYLSVSLSLSLSLYIYIYIYIYLQASASAADLWDWWMKWFPDARWLVWFSSLLACKHPCCSNPEDKTDKKTKYQRAVPSEQPQIVNRPGARKIQKNITAAENSPRSTKRSPVVVPNRQNEHPERSRIKLGLVILNDLPTFGTAFLVRSFRIVFCTVLGSRGAWGGSRFAIEKRPVASCGPLLGPPVTPVR